MADSKKKPKDDDAPASVQPASDGVQPGSEVKDNPDKPDPTSVAQVEVVKDFPV